MGSNFDSFDASPLGAFVQSSVDPGARGRNEPAAGGTVYISGSGGAWILDSTLGQWQRPWNIIGTPERPPVIYSLG